MSERIVSVWPGDRGVLQVAQLLLQALGEELLVEAGGWVLVGHGCPGACTALLAVDRQPGIGLGCGDVMRIRITWQPVLTTNAGCLLQQGICSVEASSFIRLMRKEGWQEGAYVDPPNQRTAEVASSLCE